MSFQVMCSKIIKHFLLVKMHKIDIQITPTNCLENGHDNSLNNDLIVFSSVCLDTFSISLSVVTDWKSSLDEQSGQNYLENDHNNDLNELLVVTFVDNDVVDNSKSYE